MKVSRAVILAGGYGTRLMEETEARPKPMVEIGGRPILWHIMKIYAANGITEFVLPLGYKQHMIKAYFADYYLHAADITVDLASNAVTVHRGTAESWKVTLVDTGLETMTGGRIARLREYLGEEPFCMTYGDGVAALDVAALADFHLSHGRIATVTAVRPPSRFGSLEVENGVVRAFLEKPPGDRLWINGGFFVLSPKVFDYIGGDSTVFEREPLERLARDGELMAHPHEGFWYSMDTLRDRRHLEDLWASDQPPWKIW
ncbi:glucose-1-phosphate cytidylyltransferase [Roseomonas sp. CCTCC AB2023176]|uniref:glucose-1-phosphate cytidylyltransferase n=1 Tax=Roseomonas sp. CCTCC AB2023176 TaxID=3342640 RepID=UPI0035DE8E14